MGFTTVAVEHVAVRGDRLCLLRSTFTADSGSELVIVSVYEIDANGRGSYLSLHDPDDLEAALDELESRYHEIRADVPRIAEEGFRREKEAFDRGDWEAVRACYSPAFRAVDHRPLGFPEAGLDEYVARTRALTERAPDLHGFARTVFYTERAALAVTAFAGTGQGGSEYEWDLVYVAQADDRGRYLRIEYYPIDDWAAALARFDELAAQATPTSPEIENTATRLERGMGRGKERRP